MSINTNKLVRATFLSVIWLFLISLLIIGSERKAQAAYDGGRIIDNVVFLDAASMGIQDIQNFLVARGGGIANMSFVLNCYGTDSKERQWYTAVGAPCDQTVPASHIIYYAAQIYGVNPRVILATLQKEQSLITSPNPTSWQINQAMGYACPTSGQCGGTSTFFYQIDSGTWVLRYHYERARGNMNWWTTSSSWTCGVEKNFYKPNLYPNQNVNFYDENNTYYRTHFISNAATSSFYCYTPHAYNNPQGLYGRAPYGTTGMYYSGSYNFVYYFELWFGPTKIPYAFKSPESSTIYYIVDSYKVTAPHMAVLQDYGISPESIQTISQATIDSIPSPPLSSGISQSLGYLVKSPSDSDIDGGSVYLVSVGKKYQITSMEQFYSFGFLESQITYLPISTINYLPSAAPLSNFIQTPNTAVFKVQDSAKRLIFEYDTFIALNPSGNASLVSYYFANLLPSNDPLSNRDVLVKKQGSESVYLYTNNSYYQVTTYEALNCWGLNTNLRIPIYRVIDNSYISTIAPSQSVDNCVYSDRGIKKVLVGNTKVVIPTDFAVPSVSTLPTDLQAVLDRISTRPNTLSPYVRSVNDATVWFINSGTKKYIPTYQNYLMLGLSSPNIDFIPTIALNLIPNGGIKLANGMPVKTTSSAQVAVIYNNSRIPYNSSDDFLAYGNSWSDIESYSPSLLDSSYPNNLSQPVSKYLYSASNSTLYLVDINGCYSISSDLSPEYGQNYSQLITNQLYPSSIFAKFNKNNCKNATQYVKTPNQSTVFYVNDGQKRLITRWDTLVSLAGTTNPSITIISNSSLDTIPTGPQLD